MAEHTRPGPVARPFLKWAGGKTQLLREFGMRLPPGLTTGEITRYVEPFIGGGAVFFDLTRKFSFAGCTICDANEELYLCYRVVQHSVKKLIAELKNLESAYLGGNEMERERFYYEVRKKYNESQPAIDIGSYHSDWIVRAARMIFLNRTCYNGLFRVNRHGGFNVPFGRYKRPAILNAENLSTVSARLSTTTILCGDFNRCNSCVDDKTFVYLDPPYRPLNQTSSFTSYSKNGFSEEDQIRLAKFFRELDAKGAKVMLSNSDPKNECHGDAFFDDLYTGYRIERIPAKRLINCNGSRRGQISELIITNYPIQDK